MLVLSGMWALPTCQNARNNGSPSQHVRNSLPLDAQAGGALNPDWVEQLMGFPVGWTEVPSFASGPRRRTSPNTHSKRRASGVESESVKPGFTLSETP